MHLLFPHLCPLCLQTCSAKRLLCDDCWRILPQHQHACQQCGGPLINAHICGKCLQSPPKFDQLHAAFWHQDCIPKFVIGFKFHHNFLYGKILAHALAMQIKQTYQNNTLPNVIVPVPLHWKRQFTRGYNQSILIAKQLQRTLSVPVNTKLCQRKSATKRQTDLTYQQRKTNVSHAFQVKPHNYQHIAIIDDVVTSGHTINSLATEFKRQSSVRIDIWCLARAV